MIFTFSFTKEKSLKYLAGSGYAKCYGQKQCLFELTFFRPEQKSQQNPRRVMNLERMQMVISHILAFATLVLFPSKQAPVCNITIYKKCNSICGGHPSRLPTHKCCLTSTTILVLGHWHYFTIIISQIDRNCNDLSSHFE